MGRRESLRRAPPQPSERSPNTPHRLEAVHSLVLACLADGVTCAYMIGVDTGYVKAVDCAGVEEEGAGESQCRRREKREAARAPPCLALSLQPLSSSLPCVPAQKPNMGNPIYYPPCPSPGGAPPCEENDTLPARPHRRDLTAEVAGALADADFYFGRAPNGGPPRARRGGVDEGEPADHPPSAWGVGFRWGAAPPARCAPPRRAGAGWPRLAGLTAAQGRGRGHGRLHLRRLIPGPPAPGVDAVRARPV